MIEGENGVRRFKCSVCPLTCATKSDLHQHLMTHTGEKPFDCNICGNSFRRRQHLANHMKVIHHVEPPSSQIKPETFLQPPAEPKKFTCDHCQRVFLKSESLSAHMRVHVKDKMYECPECGKKFHQSIDQINHMKTHFKTTAQVVDLHTSNLAMIKDEDITDEKAASIAAETQAALIALTNSEANEESEENGNLSAVNDSFYMDDLDSGNYVAYDERLYRTNIKGKPYCCPTCGHCFRRHSHLARHMKCKHDQLPPPPKKRGAPPGPRDYVCTYCGKGFNKPDKLRIHIRIHTGEKPYSCSVCCKTFSQRPNLLTHIKTHQKPIYGTTTNNCTVCKAQFTTALQVSNHMTQVHGRKDGEEGEEDEFGTSSDLLQVLLDKSYDDDMIITEDLMESS